MAAPTAANVIVGKPLATGGVMVAPKGTTLPTGATAATVTLDAAFVGTGYISEDGVTQSIGTDTTDIVAWGGDTVRVIQTTHALTYQFSFLETNSDVLKLVYGDENVSVTAATSSAGTRIATLINSKTLPHKAYALEIKDGDAKVRIAIPDGQITTVGDVTYVHSDAIKYDVTITCYPDDSGNKAYLYTDDGVFSGA